MWLQSHALDDPVIQSTKYLQQWFICTLKLDGILNDKFCVDIFHLIIYY